MIEYLEGNLFDSPAQVIVNTVNTVGVMGKGIALEFKNRYPQMFDKYKRACEKHLLTVGKLMLISEPDHLILLFPTKENWRLPSKISYIEKGLEHFCNTYAEHNITSIAFPKLGCGNGELQWEDVKPVMEKYLKELPIDVYIYLGKVKQEDSEHLHSKNMQDWFRKNAKDMSFTGVLDDLRNQCTLLPYEFYFNEHKVLVTFINNNLQIEYQGQTILVTEKEFFIAWDKIRNRTIFILDNENLTFTLLCYMLYSLGYLSKIRKQNKNDEMLNGFQLNEGIGRAFALNGV